MEHGIFELPLNLKRSHVSYAHTDRGRGSPARGDGDGGSRAALAVSDSPVACTLDLDLGADGRQVGRLQVPRSTNTSGWASTYVPIVSVANGSGPTVLVLGGNHGDEYEGQVAALALRARCSPSRCRAA